MRQIHASVHCATSVLTFAGEIIVSMDHTAPDHPGPYKWSGPGCRRLAVSGRSIPLEESVRPIGAHFKRHPRHHRDHLQRPAQIAEIMHFPPRPDLSERAADPGLMHAVLPNTDLSLRSYLLYHAAHTGTTIFVWNVAYPYHTSMETSARDDSIDVQYVCSRAHSAPISTAHFFACATLLP